jgi:hypothetical protein
MVADSKDHPKRPEQAYFRLQVPGRTHSPTGLVTGATGTAGGGGADCWSSLRRYLPGLSMAVLGVGTAAAATPAASASPGHTLQITARDDAFTVNTQDGQIQPVEDATSSGVPW